MDRDQFDIDAFINETEKRPSIWDMKSPEYKDRNIKKKCWEEITNIFCPEGDATEKQNVGKLNEEYFLYFRL